MWIINQKRDTIFAAVREIRCEGNSVVIDGYLAGRYDSPEDAKQKLLDAMEAKSKGSKVYAM